MKAKNLSEVVKRLARQTPARLRRSAARLNALLAGAGPASGTATSTFPPVRAGAVPEVAVKFRIRFASRKKLGTTDNQPRPAKAKAPAAEKVIVGFSEQELQQLRSIEPVLLRWMAKDKAHAAHYFADPVRSLESAGVKLDTALLRKIRAHRSRSLEHIPQLPHARIAAIDVSAEP
jgi:hypothetical protein